MAQALVLVAMALTAWLVASAVGPGIFHDHLVQAGVGHGAAGSGHIEQAFTSSMLLALPVALLTAIALALAVTWYFSRRLQRSIARVVDSAAEVAAGDYSSRISSPGLGSEFDRLAGTFNALAERLGAVESTRRRMLADLAHEMRTPLATLNAHFEALEDGVRELDEDTFAVLRSSTGRLERLAQDIGAVSRAEEGSLEIHRELTGPRQLVEAACRAAADRYHDKGVTLRGDVSTDLPVLVDPARMGQVLGNLLDNALRHTPQGGSVTVFCRNLERWVEFEVRDTGEGIAPEHLDHIFDRFYRADPARSRPRGGSGIGLTITKALVEAHGGGIFARSAGPGQGAAFTVRLPLS
ncbi:HAMP domain-containing sensor histidine kinase [Planomonospora parontospora]|uniref:HAMP domain-containing sensor histidine kinase n=1 Tax=Planomonospora parontospora TaxID=58119 RepID=UPI001945522C|nr:ATP-binding protein [Planomonospora parontospora]GGL58693.1 putative sensor histidine kinase [Planomonospora parontospora subsp. antibiotica]GII18003.1 putative sensor histidine kinase [Planomonospora parontospora subsp. antibiotica]